MQNTLKTCTFLLNLFAVDLFRFIIGTQPTEKEFISGGETTDSSFQRIGKHAKSVILEQQWNIFFVIGQIVVIGILHLDVGVLKFNKDQREPVDINQNIRPSRIALAFDPELCHRAKIVVQGFGKINHADSAMLGSAVCTFIFNRNAVANEIVNFFIG